MPDMYFTGSGPIVLPASSALCVLALGTASTRRAVLNRVCVSFNGTSATAIPVLCQIARITNTPSGSAIPAGYGPNPLNPGAPAAQTTAACASTASPGAWTTAPAAGAVLWEMEIPPTLGMPEWFPLGQEPEIAVSSWAGVFLTAGATVTAYTSLYHTE